MFYIFHGENNYAKQQQLDKMTGRLGDQEMLGLNTTKLEGKGLSVGELRMACGAMPFLSPVRLVLVNDFLTSKPGAAVLNELVDYLPTLPDFTRLFFLESKSVSLKSKTAKLADSDPKGYIKVFEQPKGNQIDRWIVNEVKERGGQIAPRAANLLAINVGSDLIALSNEVEKLVLYRGEELIQPGDVELLSPYAAEASIFDLVDALGSRNGKRAVTLLQQALSEGTEPFYLFTMIVRQFRLMIQTKACMEDRMRPDEIAKVVGMHPFVAKKVHKQAQSFSMNQLKQVYQHLLEIDEGVKTGKTQMPIALNMLVVTLGN